MTQKRIATNLDWGLDGRLGALQHSCHVEAICKLPMQPNRASITDVWGEWQGRVLLQRVGETQKLLCANHFEGQVVVSGCAAARLKLGSTKLLPNYNTSYPMLWHTFFTQEITR